MTIMTMIIVSTLTIGATTIAIVSLLFSSAILVGVTVISSPCREDAVTLLAVVIMEGDVWRIKTASLDEDTPLDMYWVNEVIDCDEVNCTGDEEREERGITEWTSDEGKIDWVIVAREVTNDEERNWVIVGWVMRDEERDRVIVGWVMRDKERGRVIEGWEVTNDEGWWEIVDWVMREGIRERRSEGKIVSVDWILLLAPETTIDNTIKL